MLHPNNWFVICYNIILLCICLIYFFRFPILVGFDVAFEDVAFKYISLIVFVMELFIKTNTGFYNDMGLVTDRI